MIFMPIFSLWLLIVTAAILLGIILLQFFLGKGEAISARLKDMVPKILLVVLLFAIGLRPMIPNAEVSKVQTSNLDILFVIDNTISMNAEDYGGTGKRLDGAKADAEHIMEEFSGARFAVITFGNFATIASPYTYDQDTVSNVISSTEPISEVYARGSNLETPISAMKTIIKSSEKKKAAEKDRAKILFFISDGEITDDSKLPSYAEMKEHFNYSAVLGYGTAEGGKMKSQRDYSIYEYIQDRSDIYSIGGDAISKIDEDNLRAIAANLGADYIHANSQDALKPALQKIANLAKASADPEDGSANMDLYFIAAALLLPVLLYEFNKIWRRKI